MLMEFKDIHMGIMIKTRVVEESIEIDRICNFLKCTEDQVNEMYKAQSLDTHILLRWSKLLEYDFFRIYSQHLILYAPQAGHHQEEPGKNSALPKFRKHLYTKEIIDFILGEIHSGAMTKKRVTEVYKIPRSTLHKWLNKYGSDQ